MRLFLQKTYYDKHVCKYGNNVHKLLARADEIFLGTWTWIRPHQY